MKEPFIPSPETENDPPAFNITPPPYTLINKEEEQEQEHEHEQQNDDGPVRILCPTAEFQGFMLYTGDVPLMGFRADELEKERPREERVREEEAGRDLPESDCGSNINLRPSWWRHGGVGEGGDEFVRGMGEWLGLVEVVSGFFFLWQKLTLCKKVEQARLSRRVGRRRGGVERDFRRRAFCALSKPATG